MDIDQVAAYSIVDLFYSIEPAHLRIILVGHCFYYDLLLPFVYFHQDELDFRVDKAELLDQCVCFRIELFAFDA